MAARGTPTRRGSTDAPGPADLDSRPHPRAPTDHPHSDQDALELRLIRSVPAFSGLAPAVLAELARKLTEQAFPAGAVVLHEGEPADRLFVVVEGEVEISIAGPAGRAPLCRLSDGECFGEIGLLAPRRERTARVTATRPLLVSSLGRLALHDVLEAHPEARAVLDAAADEALTRTLVKRSAPFGRLDAERVHSLTSRLRPLDLPAGATLFRQGEPGDACYLLREGALEVVREEAGAERRVAELEPGDILGEAALLTRAPRDATLRALRDSRLLALQRADLLAILGGDAELSTEAIARVRLHERPLRGQGIRLHPRPTSDAGTIWVLEDPARFGTYKQLSPLGFFVWQRLDGRHNVEEIVAAWPERDGRVDGAEVARLMGELVAEGFVEAKQLREDVDPSTARPSFWRRLRRLLGAGS